MLLSTLHRLVHLVLTAVLWHRSYDYFPFISKETGGERVSNLLKVKLGSSTQAPVLNVICHHQGLLLRTEAQVTWLRSLGGHDFSVLAYVTANYSFHYAVGPWVFILFIDWVVIKSIKLQGIRPNPIIYCLYRTLQSCSLSESEQRSYDIFELNVKNVPSSACWLIFLEKMDFHIHSLKRTVGS